MLTSKVASALIFKLCLPYTSEEAKLSCFDKLVNCSNLQSEAAIINCNVEINRYGVEQTYEAYIAKVRNTK